PVDGIARLDDGSYEVIDGGSAFTIGNPDFDVLSFRSNAVLRWEWRPGSTLFVVWQQDRSERGSLPRGVGPRRLWDSLGAQGDNFLAVKASFWLPVQ
ncbi:MAG: hypothetical protein ACREON_19125, partial [Gemmatimonadaceae bacterium]